MHKFIEKLQERTMPLKRREIIMQETAKAIETLINDAKEIPGVGKLICQIDIKDGMIDLGMGIKKPDDQASLIQQPGT